MKETFKKLNDSLSKAQQDVLKYKEAIRALQLVCEHEWSYQGHDHKYDHYRCVICGDTQKE